MAGLHGVAQGRMLRGRAAEAPSDVPRRTVGAMQGDREGRGRGWGRRSRDGMRRLAARRGAGAQRGLELGAAEEKKGCGGEDERTRARRRRQALSRVWALIARIR